MKLLPLLLSHVLVRSSNHTARARAHLKINMREEEIGANIQAAIDNMTVTANQIENYKISKEKGIEHDKDWVKSAINKIKDKKAEKQQREDNLKQQTGKLHAKLNALHKQAERAKNNLSKLETRVNDIQSQSEGIAKALQNARKAEKQAKQQRQKLEHAKHHMVQKENELRKEKHSLKDSLSKIEGEKNRVNGEINHQEESYNYWKRSHESALKRHYKALKKIFGYVKQSQQEIDEKDDFTRLQEFADKARALCKCADHEAAGTMSPRRIAKYGECCEKVNEVHEYGEGEAFKEELKNKLEELERLFKEIEEIKWDDVSAVPHQPNSESESFNSHDDSSSTSGKRQDAADGSQISTDAVDAADGSEHSLLSEDGSSIHVSDGSHKSRKPPVLSGDEPLLSTSSIHGSDASHKLRKPQDQRIVPWQKPALRNIRF